MAVGDVTAAQTAAAPSASALDIIAKMEQLQIDSQAVTLAGTETNTKVGNDNSFLRISSEFAQLTGHAIKAS